MVISGHPTQFPIVHPFAIHDIPDPPFVGKWVNSQTPSEDLFDKDEIVSKMRMVNLSLCLCSV